MTDVLLLEPAALVRTPSGLHAPAKSLEAQKTYLNLLRERGSHLRIASFYHLEPQDGAVPAGYAPVADWLPEETVLREPVSRDAVRRWAPDVVWTLPTKDARGLAGAGVPLYLMVEVTRSIRAAIARAQPAGLLDRSRSSLGLLRDEVSLRRLLRRSAGAEFNGPAAAAAYAGLAPRSLTFCDHRILREDLAELARTERPTPADRLRVGFSGRWMRIKGAHLLPDLARRTAALNDAVEFHLFGSGPLEEQIRREAPGNVVLHGFTPMPEWKEQVRQGVDTMVFPHLQGDPSGTYFEAMGCGASLVGFANETLSPLVDQGGVGQTVPLGDVQALAEALDGLQRDPRRNDAYRHSARDLMSGQPYEDVARRRVEGLLDAMEQHRRRTTAR